MKLMTDLKGIQFARLKILWDSPGYFAVSYNFEKDLHHPNSRMMARLVENELNEEILNEYKINTYY